MACCFCGFGSGWELFFPPHLPPSLLGVSLPVCPDDTALPPSLYPPPLPPPTTRPLLNDSIYRPQVLARKEIYIFLKKWSSGPCELACVDRERPGAGIGGQRRCAGQQAVGGGPRPPASMVSSTRRESRGGQAVRGGPGVRAAGASSLRRTLPSRLGRPQKNMYFDQNGPFLKLVTLRVRAQPAPSRSCILSSGLVTTKNRCPSPEAGLSRRPEKGQRAQAPACGPRRPAVGSPCPALWGPAPCAGSQGQVRGRL